MDVVLPSKTYFLKYAYIAITTTPDKDTTQGVVKRDAKWYANTQEELAHKNIHASVTNNFPHHNKQTF